MAFWGVEVKPGKPFTHKYDGSKGRLHISMATLGFGTAITKSTLQCNVGNKSPVYLCSLYPGKTESLQLNLEFEEDGQVVFSVIGPRSIHLCGYYLAGGRNGNTLEESESYGEDIGDTETERSDYSDEDDYDDSFIDDGGNPEVFPPSPISNEEEASYDSGPKGKKGSRRRLRKKYQLVESDDDGCLKEKRKKYPLVESDDDGCLKEKIIVNGSMHDQFKEIDNEDSIPISSIYKVKASGRVSDQEMDDNVDRGTVDAGNKEGEDGGNIIIEAKLKTENVRVDSLTHREAEPSDHLVDPCTVLDVGDIKKSKKKKKGKEKETKSSCNGHSIELDNDAPDEPKMEKMTQDLLAGNEQHQQHTDDKKTETSDKILPSSQVGQGQDEKPKKKRKERSKKETLSNADGADISNLVSLPQRNEHNNQDAINEDVKISDNDALPSAETDPQKRTKRRKKEHTNKASHPEGDNGNDEGIIQDYKAYKDTAGSNSLIHKLSEGKEQHQKLTIENLDNGAHDFPDGNQSEDKKDKKRKKKSKSQGNAEVVNSVGPVSVEQSSEMMKEDGNNTADAKPSQVRTLSNGLVIQELEMGAEDGKIAALGKKISIHYTGKLKENGVVFESNAGQAPFKFRLGKGEVIEGWDVGLEGMRVGEKRRLVIPPSMTSKNDGQSAKLPPNSWLVYDFELVKVH